MAPPTAKRQSHMTEHEGPCLTSRVISNMKCEASGTEPERTAVAAIRLMLLRCADCGSRADELMLPT